MNVDDDKFTLYSADMLNFLDSFMTTQRSLNVIKLTAVDCLLCIQCGPISGSEKRERIISTPQTGMSEMEQALRFQVLTAASVKIIAFWVWHHIVPLK
jgi:hypothetical protein